VEKEKSRNQKRGEIMGKTEKSKGKTNQELKNTSASLVTAMAVEACLGASAPQWETTGWSDMSRRSASSLSAMAVVDNLAPQYGSTVGYLGSKKRQRRELVGGGV
jgi:hypothetical protein